MGLTQKQIELIKEIQDKKQQGDVKAISEKTGFTREHVSKCLNIMTPRFNEKIVDAAVEIILKRDKRVEKMIERIPQ